MCDHVERVVFNLQDRMQTLRTQEVSASQAIGKVRR